MKQKFLRTLAILVAALVAVPAVLAAAYVIGAPTQVWKYEGSVPGSDAYSAVALTDGKLYTAGINTDYSSPYKTLYTFDNGAVSTSSLGYSSLFPGALAADDNGNLAIWYGTHQSDIGTVYLKSLSGGIPTLVSGKNIPLSSAGLSTWLYYYDASGNLVTGTGYLWFTAASGTVIDKVTVSNGSYSKTTTYSIADALGEGNILGASSSIKVYKSDASTDTHSLLVHDIGGEFYDCTISGSTITATKITGFPVARKSSNAAGSTMFELQGKKILVYNTGSSNGSANSRANEFVVWNMTDNIYTTINPFTTTVSVTASPDGLIGCWLDVQKVSDTQVNLFAFSPGVGAAKYSITATQKDITTAPLPSLSYEYIKQTVTSPGRQDIKLTWTAPTGYAETEITGYNIYRNGSLYKTVDANTLTYTNINVTSNYTYQVVPTFQDVAEDATLGKSVTTTEVTFIPIAATLTRIVTYEGYANVQLFWEYPGYGAKPTYYNVYRDGVLVGTSQSYNFYEEKLAEGTHTYYVESVYSSNTATANSNTKTVDVVARNTNKTTYTLEVIYNYPHEQITGTTPNLFERRNYYRQGAYYNGTWYIAQRADQLSTKDAGKGQSDVTSGVDGTTGGVVTFSAVDPRTGIQSKPITLPEFSNVGVATDNKGNIFVRQNNFDRLKATRPSDATKTEEAAFVTSDNFGRRLTSGYIYLASDGYTTAIDVDLSSLDLASHLTDWNTLGSGDGYTDLDCKSQRGRSDYYCLEGDVTSAEGAYLYFSPSKSTTVVKVNIKVSGTTATVGTPEFVAIGDYTNFEGEAATCSYGVENYAFPVDGRDTYIGQIRSNGYFGIHGVNDYHPIFTTDSRINNSGGTTIEFNNELFIIAPQTMFSASSGDFLVAKGIKSDYADVTTADLSNAMPVATYSQTDMATGGSTNASGNWMFAEYGKLDGTSLTVDQKDQAECIFIYQYVPGERFAKYMLYPNNIFPAPPVAINLDPVYTSEEGATVVDENSATGANETAVDLLRFDGAASWTKPDYDNDGAEAYVYDSYNVKIYAENGQVFLEQKVALNDANYGNETDGYKFPLDNMWKDRQYFINVSANYVNIADANDTHVSETSYAYTEDGYNGVAAEGTVKVYTNPAFPVWYDENGNLVYKYSHRVDINFNKPEFDGERVEPVTHYEIWLDKDKDGEFEEQLTNFNLMTGIYDPATRADVGTIESQIAVTDGKIVSATYNPSTTKGYALGEKEEAANRTDDYLCVLTFFQVGDFNTNEGAVMGTGDASALNPANWNYQLRSVYAAGNARISTTKTFDMATGTPIYTGVENAISGANSLKLYPVPTEYLLNIDCDEAIYSVQVYDEAGRLVENFIGNNMNSMQVDLGNLATGYYFVKVNANHPVKILKK